MDRNKSSDLGERQAEGNLGNERVRSTSSDDFSRRRNRDLESVSPEDRRSPGSDTPDMHDEDERTDGSER